MTNSNPRISRRDLLQNTAIVAVGSAAFNASALSYSRIVGANDRIALGHIGVGVRGRELPRCARLATTILKLSVFDFALAGALDGELARSGAALAAPPAFGHLN